MFVARYITGIALNWLVWFVAHPFITAFVVTFILAALKLINAHADLRCILEGARS